MFVPLQIRGKVINRLADEVGMDLSETLSVSRSRYNDGVLTKSLSRAF